MSGFIELPRQNRMPEIILDKEYYEGCQAATHKKYPTEQEQRSYYEDRMGDRPISEDEYQQYIHESDERAKDEVSEASQTFKNAKA